MTEGEILAIGSRSGAIVEARPTFKNRWRVHIVLASGEELTSAQSSRDTASRAAVALSRHLGVGPRDTK